MHISITFWVNLFSSTCLKPVAYFLENTDLLDKLNWKPLIPGILLFCFCHLNSIVGSARPGFQKLKKYLFLQLQFITKNYTENISLTEQFEHLQSYFTLI